MTRVEVYADIVCPFAYIGLKRLQERRDELNRSDVHLHIRSWPLEWVNGQPVDPHFIGEEIDEIRPQVATDLFQGFDTGAFPASSVPGLALTIAAYAVSAPLGEQVAMELRDLLFEQGRDVGDPSVLAELASKYELTIPDERVVRSEYEDGKQRGVVGSPHFFVGGTATFCPALDIKRVEDALVVKVDEAAFDELVTSVFA